VVMAIKKYYYNFFGEVAYRRKYIYTQTWVDVVIRMRFQTSPKKGKGDMNNIKLLTIKSIKAKFLPLMETIKVVSKNLTDRGI